MYLCLRNDYVLSYSHHIHRFCWEIILGYLGWDVCSSEIKWTQKFSNLISLRKKHACPSPGSCRGQSWLEGMEASCGPTVLTTIRVECTYMPFLFNKCCSFVGNCSETRELMYIYESQCDESPSFTPNPFTRWCTHIRVSNWKENFLLLGHDILYKNSLWLISFVQTHGHSMRVNYANKLWNPDSHIERIKFDGSEHMQLSSSKIGGGGHICIFLCSQTIKTIDFKRN